MKIKKGICFVLISLLLLHPAVRPAQAAQMSAQAAQVPAQAANEPLLNLLPLDTPVGHTLSKEDYAGKALVIALGRITCGNCQQFINTMESLIQENAWENDIAFLFFDLDQPIEDVAAFVAQKEYAHVSFYKSNWYFAWDMQYSYGLVSSGYTPWIFFFDDKGDIVETASGAQQRTTVAAILGAEEHVVTDAVADPVVGNLPYLRKPYDGTPIDGLFLEAYSTDGGTLSFDWFWSDMDTGAYKYIGYSADGYMPVPGPSEPGMYKIETVVINHKDGGTSEPVRVSSLIWIVSEPVITLPVKEIHVAEGEPIILDAQVTTADGGTLFYWWHQADASDIAGTFRRMDELAVDGYTGNGGQSAYLVDDTHPAPGVYVYQLLVFNVRVLWPDGDGVIGNGYDVNGTWFYGGTWATEFIWVHVGD